MPIFCLFSILLTTSKHFRVTNHHLGYQVNAREWLYQGFQKLSATMILASVMDFRLIATTHKLHLSAISQSFKDHNRLQGNYVTASTISNLSYS